MLKRTVIGLVLSALAPAAGIAAEPPPLEFSGVFSAGGRTLVSLTDPASATSQWIEPGHVFAGYAVAAYNAAEDTVLVTKDGVSTRLRLKASKIQSAAAPEIGAMTREMQLMLWARIRGLESEDLIIALVASGNADMKMLADAYQRQTAATGSKRKEMDDLQSRAGPKRADPSELARLLGQFTASVKIQEEIHARLLQKAEMLKKVLQEQMDH